MYVFDDENMTKSILTRQTVKNEGISFWNVMANWKVDRNAHTYLKKSLAPGWVSGDRATCCMSSWASDLVYMISCMICGFSCDILAVTLRRAFRKMRCANAAAGPHVSRCVLLHSTQKAGSKVGSPVVRIPKSLSSINTSPSEGAAGWIGTQFGRHIAFP